MILYIDQKNKVFIENEKKIKDSYEKKKAISAFIYSTFFLLSIWSVKVIEVVFSLSFVKYGLYPRRTESLYGILTSPFIHSDLTHILSNTISLWLSLFFIVYAYREIAFRVFIINFFFSGFAVWLFGRESFHIGASGLIYGFLSFLFFIGAFRKDKQSIAVSLIITFLYGGLIWGVLPYDPAVSFESHLAGFVIGLITAILFFKNNTPKIEINNE